jgi:hypothetical protein
MPILQASLLDVVAPRCIMRDHVESFGILTSLTRLLQSGPSVATSRSDELARLVERHHEAHILAYGPFGLKPEWHHVLHARDRGTSLGRVLSCRVTAETPNSQGLWRMGIRKRSMLYKQVMALDDEKVFQMESLVKP